MKILVANLGSTSFKSRLYDLGDPSEPLLARAGVERVGQPLGRVKISTGAGEVEQEQPIPDHAAALKICLDRFTDPTQGVIGDVSEIAAIGFKAVHARGVSGVQLVDDSVLSAMEAFNDVAPAHNPPYVRAMRLLAERFPAIPLVAAFETGFHQSIPEGSARYAVPEEWAAFGIRRYGFHGASHRFIAERMAALLGRSDLKIISCHLGGSSSLCASRAGLSVETTMGMSPQSGLPQSNRVGDFDPFALPVILRETGLSLDQALAALANKSGLAGMSGTSGDLRDIEEEAEKGNAKAALALESFIASIRRYLGAYLLELGGADAIVFTGGIGENSSRVRSGVMRDLDWFGIEMDWDKNREVKGESLLSRPTSRVQVWAVPTNEEIIVARQARDLLKSRRAG